MFGAINPSNQMLMAELSRRKELSFMCVHRNIYNIPLRLSSIVVIIDIVALFISYIVSNYYFTSFSEKTAIAFGSQGFNYFFLLGALVLLNFARKGHYRKRVPWWQQVRTIVQTIFATALITLLMNVIFDLEMSMGAVTAGWMVTMVLLLCFRHLTFQILPKFRDWKVPVTLFGDNQMVIDCIHAFYNDGHTGIHVKNIMLRDKEKEPVCLDFIPPSHSSITMIDATGDYLDYILQNKDVFYIIGLEGVRGDNRDRLIQALVDNEISYAVVPPTKRLHLYGMNPQHFFGNDVMLLHEREFLQEPLERFLERAFDITVSAALMPVLGIITLAVYTLKKMEGSDTPIFYGGKRIGKGGKEFNCWKFCTMRRDADQVLNNLLEQDPVLKEEWEKFQKLKDDPRIDSRISKKLRSTSLDELPQLWNVMKGEMSLVGPRPILPEQKQDYGELLGLYESVRPGVTGLWQVSGRNDTTFQQRVYWDGWYIRNWSFWHDVVILFKTISVLFNKNGAY